MIVINNNVNIEPSYRTIISRIKSIYTVNHQHHLNCTTAILYMYLYITWIYTCTFHQKVLVFEHVYHLRYTVSEHLFFFYQRVSTWTFFCMVLARTSFFCTFASIKSHHIYIFFRRMLFMVKASSFFCELNFFVLFCESIFFYESIFCACHKYCGQA